MRDEAWSENSVLLNDDPATVYLCHDCLQEVLVEQIEEEKVHKMLPRLVDGSCDRQSILKSAEKMHPCLTPKQSFFTYLPEGPTLEPGEGSNSVKGLRRRRQKQYEIDKILRRLRYDQRVRMLRLKSRREVKASDLKTQTPFDIDPYRERYKKQGLEWNDRSGQGEERKASKTSSMHEKVAKGAVDHSLGGEDAFTCYCRESNDGEALIQCSSGSCMFGWIHFRCSGLNEMPDTSESHYVCQHCTGDYPMLTRSRRDPMSLMVKHGDDGPQTDPWDSDCYVASLSEDEDSSTNGGEPGDETEESQREANPFEWIAVNTPKSLPMR